MATGTLYVASCLSSSPSLRSRRPPKVHVDSRGRVGLGRFPSFRCDGDDEDREATLLSPSSPSSTTTHSGDDDDDDDEDPLFSATAPAVDPGLGVPVFSDAPRPPSSRQQQPPSSKSRLVKERRARNATETEESFVVQYLAAGGWRHLPLVVDTWPESERLESRPSRAASSLHAGAGQQVLGWGPQQRCDLLLAFEGSPQGGGGGGGRPARLLYVNHHGSCWHYSGHYAGCVHNSRKNASSAREKPLSARMDGFRRGLCEALTAVAPQRCRFDYAVTTSCSHVHGEKTGPSLPCAFAGASTKHRNARDCLLAARKSGGPDARAVWLPPLEESLEVDQLVRDIYEGTKTGFVTVRGGRERRDARERDPAGSRFGFCVQNHQARWQDLSERTREEIALHHGWDLASGPGRKKLRDYLAKQPPRTLNAVTFLGHETLSTTYLRWLMEERGFTGFRVTHFLAYEFRDWGADYLLPVLQRRHEEKMAGRAGAAECLKLLGNGSYGYNGLESANYDDLRLVTSENLRRKIASDLRHLSVKHITQLGVVRVLAGPKKKKPAQKRKKKKRTRRRTGRPRRNSFILDEAEEDDGDDDDDDDDDDDMEEEEQDSAPEEQEAAAAAAAEAAAAAVDETAAELRRDLASSGYDAFTRSYCDQVFECLTGPRSGRGAERVVESEHNYCVRGRRPPSPTPPTPPAGGGGQDGRSAKYTFLWAVVTDGSKKRIFNTLPRAVAVLSNSKRLFLGHLSLMFRCLDPRLAELCYVDTDSCVWSLSHASLDHCLSPERVNRWRASAILADESAPSSCHGKLKLEGLFDGGLFKTMKIYRLFKKEAAAAGEATEGGEEWRVAYTRCKGINRWAAEHLPDGTFDPRDESVLGESRRQAVYRNALRPSRTGEIRLVSESRSLALPFNFKRWVHPDGIHTSSFGRP